MYFCKVSNPVLVEITRGGVLESFHRGVVCVVDKHRKIVFGLGNVMQVCYPRSALKFFQHIPLITSGAYDSMGFTPEELAIMCGSHNGEDFHVAVVDAILQKSGLTRDHLQCGTQWPSHRGTANRMIRNGEKPQAIHNNCSGKHAGFLALCVYLQLPVSNYLDPQHPVQQQILQVVADYHEYPADQMVTALDGCSAPIFSIPVYHQAIAYMQLGNPDLPDEGYRRANRLICDAVAAHPEMVAGSQRYCTEMMQVCAPQVIGKTGAEGVYSLLFPELHLGCSIKIDDGKMLPQYNVAQALIAASGLFSEAALAPLQHHLQAPVKNYNNLVTGEINVAGHHWQQAFYRE